MAKAIPAPTPAARIWSAAERLAFADSPRILLCLRCLPQPPRISLDDLHNSLDRRTERRNRDDEGGQCVHERNSPFQAPEGRSHFLGAARGGEPTSAGELTWSAPGSGDGRL